MMMSASSRRVRVNHASRSWGGTRRKASLSVAWADECTLETHCALRDAPVDGGRSLLVVPHGLLNFAGD